MKKNYIFKSLLVAATVAVAACSTDEGTDPNSGFVTIKDSGTIVNESYVVAVTSTDGTDYMLYTDELGSENLTIVGAGVEAPLTSAQWYFYSNLRVFGLKYSDGDPTPAATYVMGDERPIYGGGYTSYRFTTYGAFGDYMVTSSANSYTAESTGVYESYYGTEVYPRHMYIGQYNYANGMFSGQDFVADNYLGTGEYCSMSGFAQSNGMLYATVYPMGVTGYGATVYEDQLKAESLAYYGDEDKYKEFLSSGWGGSGSGSFKPGEAATTLFPDQFHLAIFTNVSDFPKNPILIKDSRMSPACGRQQSAQYVTIGTDQEGDVYIFSPGNERSYAGSGVQLYSDVDKTVTMDHAASSDGLFYKAAGTHKGSVMRIQSGQIKLDETYGTNGVFDVESAMGDRSFISAWYITGSTSKFLVKAMNDANTQYVTTNNKFYVVDVVNKSAIEVTGMPDPTTITGTSRNPFFEGGKAYMGIVSSENALPAIYSINAETGVASIISYVTCSGISSIGKLVKYE